VQRRVSSGLLLWSPRCVRASGLSAGGLRQYKNVGSHTEPHTQPHTHTRARDVAAEVR
jgi:hypothetical protein